MGRRRRYLTTLLVGVTGLAFCPLQVGVVRGHSMDPTLRDGQLMVVARGHSRSAPRKNSIVLFRHQGMNYVKRVYAVEGETIYLLMEGNHPPRAMLEPVRASDATALMARFARTGHMRVRTLRVPPGTFFAIGDALTRSIDSRELGPIANDAIIGTVLAWPRPIPTPDLELSIPAVPVHGYPPIMM